MFPHLHLNFLTFSGNRNKHFQFFMYFTGIHTKMDHIFLRDLSRTLLPLMEILPILKPLIQFSIPELWTLPQAGLQIIRDLVSHHFPRRFLMGTALIATLKVLAAGEQLWADRSELEVVCWAVPSSRPSAWFNHTCKSAPVSARPASLISISPQFTERRQVKEQSHKGAPK